MVKNNKQSEKVKNERKEPIDLIHIRILDVLKKNTNHDKQMVLQDLTRNVYGYNEEQWKRIGTKERDHEMDCVRKNVEQIGRREKEKSKSAWQPPIIYAYDRKAKTKGTRLKIWYEQNFTFSEMNLLYASLLHCTMIPAVARKELLKKVADIACVDADYTMRGVEELYDVKTAEMIKAENSFKKNRIENNLLENLDMLLEAMAEPYEARPLMIEFDYCNLTKDGKYKPKNNKHWKYKLSPVALIIDQDTFWLLGIDERDKNEYGRYRVDRMKNIEQYQDYDATDLQRDDKKAYNENYSVRHLLGSFGKTIEVVVRLLNKDTAYNVVYETFGDDFEWVDYHDGFDRIKIIGTEYGIAKWALINLRDVEVETESVRKAIVKELQGLNEMYLKKGEQ
ncbi:MAG: WYL domain-containing protein [Lachnospiraceae bacterium]|nr:WYL domain-containing protein [Lachnospiraceae bacterium]